MYHTIDPACFLTFDQFRARLEKYQDERTLLYEYLVAKGTRDAVSFEAMMFQKDVVDLIQDDPDLVERITAKRDWKFCSIL